MVDLCALLLENSVEDIVISMTRKLMWSVPINVIVLFASSLENGDLAKIKKRFKKRTKMTTGITFSINIGTERVSYCKYFI